MNPDEPRPRDAACSRSGLLLSLDRDGAATPSQSAELEAHLAACAHCRRDRTADRVVGGRLQLVAGGHGGDAGVPSGFAVRVVAAALASRAAAAAENRFLRVAAAAAVLVALTAGGLLAARPAPSRGVDAGGVESARHLTRASIVPSRLAANR
jgi:hypothetical protein